MRRRIALLLSIALPAALQAQDKPDFSGNWTLNNDKRDPATRGQDFVTKSRWEGSSLITEGENTITSPMGEVKIKTKEIRMLSDDGKTLTVISTFTSPRGEVTRKLVYDKQ